MSFVDPAFFIFILLCALLPAFIRLFAAERRVLIWQILIVLLSILFYCYYSVSLFFVMLGVTAVCYSGILFFRRKRGSIWLRRGLLFILIFLSLTPLAYFKYGDFAGLPGYGLVIAGFALLPPGISFYTFQNLSALIDSYRSRNGHSASESSQDGIVGYLAYIFFFPQLIAGPIVRVKEFFRYMQQDRIRSRFEEGAGFLISGYFRKVVLADRLAPVVKETFEIDATGSLVLVSVIGFGLQIYFDFSGYTHIARGVAALAGIRLPENFADPYFAESFQDFWRKWHRTLSGWLRDYIYIPAGGSRNGLPRMFIAILLTMLLGGLWHGAHWNFVLWGGIHGILLIVEMPIRKRIQSYRGRLSSVATGIYRIFCIATVFLLWIPFRAAMGSGDLEPFERTIQIFTEMFHYFVGDTAFSITHRNSQFRVLLAGILFLVVLRYFDMPGFFYNKRAWWMVRGIAAGLLIFLIIYFADSSEPFVYFVF